MRRIFAECRSVSANRRLPSDANHTGVAMPVPSRLKLVTLRYRPGKSASGSAAGSRGRSIVCVVGTVGFRGWGCGFHRRSFRAVRWRPPLVVRGQEQVRVVAVEDCAEVQADVRNRRTDPSTPRARLRRFVFVLTSSHVCRTFGIAKSARGETVRVAARSLCQLQLVT
jgi:hypothetical protein